ncbi:MAG: tetratricopeptide repeat protein [Thermoleophilia bacterium]
MLLDEKRTKRIVRVIAVLTSIAFAGVGAIAIVLVLLGNHGTSVTAQAVKDARSQVKKTPNDATALSDLSAALLADKKTDESITTAQKAVALAPRDFTATQQLVNALTTTGRNTDAINALQKFTLRNPKVADAFLQQGQLAEQQGSTLLARLSYQRYLELVPDGPTSAAVRQRLKSLTPKATTTGK